MCSSVVLFHKTSYVSTTTTLDLWHNNLISLPAEICNLINLKNLYLGINQLTSLPA
jgi:Leucine-rich repeat (LRR) protein